jgi:hypothetical protein
VHETSSTATATALATCSRNERCNWGYAPFTAAMKNRAPRTRSPVIR